MGVKMSNCYLCNHPVIQDQVKMNRSINMGPAAAKLCNVCGIGNLGERCTAFRDYPPDPRPKFVTQ